MDIGPVNVLVKIKRQNRENDYVYLFCFETLRLEIWHAMRVVEILF